MVSFEAICQNIKKYGCYTMLLSDEQISSISAKGFHVEVLMTNVSYCVLGKNQYVLNLCRITEEKHYHVVTENRISCGDEFYD